MKSSFLLCVASLALGCESAAPPPHDATLADSVLESSVAGDSTTDTMNDAGDAGVPNDINPLLDMDTR